MILRNTNNGMRERKYELEAIQNDAESTPSHWSLREQKLRLLLKQVNEELASQIPFSQASLSSAKSRKSSANLIPGQNSETLSELKSTIQRELKEISSLALSTRIGQQTHNTITIQQPKHQKVSKLKQKNQNSKPFVNNDEKVENKIKQDERTQNSEKLTSGKHKENKPK